MSKELEWIEFETGFIARHQGKYLAEPIDTGREFIREFKSMRRAKQYIDAIGEVRKHGLDVHQK